MTSPCRWTFCTGVPDPNFEQRASHFCLKPLFIRLWMDSVMSTFHRHQRLACLKADTWSGARHRLQSDANMTFFCCLTFRTHFCKTLPRGKQLLQINHLPRCVCRLSCCLHSTLNVSKGACQIYTFPHDYVMIQLPIWWLKLAPEKRCCATL